MFRLSRLQILGMAGLAAGLVLGACSSSSSGTSCGDGSPPDLSGDYHLALYKVGGNAVEATGELHLGTTTSGRGDYVADLIILAQEVADTGVYTLTGTSCIKQESSSGHGTTNGTYTRQADTVTVTGTNSQAGGELISRWVLDT